MTVVVAISLVRDQGRQGETTLVGRSLVYGPVEDNTPSELKPVYMHGRNLRGLSSLEPVYMHGRNLRGLSPLSGTNTPSELTGGITGGLPAEIYDRHQRG
jgi:hypothetical protein